MLKSVVIEPSCPDSLSLAGMQLSNLHSRQMLRYKHQQHENMAMADMTTPDAASRYCMWLML